MSCIFVVAFYVSRASLGIYCVVAFSLTAIDATAADAAAAAAATATLA